MTTSAPTKKQVERWQLDRFASLFSSFPLGTIEKSEEPDFVVLTPERRVGIELTDLYRETPEGAVPQQAQESLRDRIAKTAGRKYAELGLPPLHVSVHFNPQHMPLKQDVERISTMIANLVAKNVPPPGSSFREDYDWVNRDYFPEEVIHVGAWNLPGADAPFFTSPSASFVPSLEPGDIERALDLKEPKLARYRQRCDELWLLVSCDGGQLSTFFEHEDDVVERTYRSGFNRAFLLRHVAGKLHELRLQAP